MGLIDNENKVGITVLGIIYLAALGIVLTDQFTTIKIGTIGIISWIVFILGTLAFIVWAIMTIISYIR